MDPQQTCPYCHSQISTESYFCQNCGKKLKDKPLSTGIGRQIIVYAISILLPPAGFFYGYRYIKQKNNKATIIGGIAIVLTIISSVYSIWYLMTFINSFNQQMQLYKNLGY